MIADGIARPESSGRATTDRPPTRARRPRASQVRAARQRATRAQADVVTHWLRRLAAVPGRRSAAASHSESPAAGSGASHQPDRG